MPASVRLNQKSVAILYAIPVIWSRARGLYLEQRSDSRTHKQAVSVVCETLDLKRRVNAWAAKFTWKGDV